MAGSADVLRAFPVHALAGKNAPSTSPFVGSSLASRSSPKASHRDPPYLWERSETPESTDSMAGRDTKSTAASMHAKLHKSKKEDRRPPTDILSDHPGTSSSSLAKSGSKVKLRQNLRKLQGRHDDGGLDLSRTTEENELRSGLSLHSQNLASTSASDLALGKPHKRTISGNSQQSSRSFTPTTPYVHPIRQTSLSYHDTSVHPSSGLSKPPRHVNTSPPLSISSSYQGQIHGPPSGSSIQYRQRRGTAGSSDTERVFSSRAETPTDMDPQPPRAFGFTRRRGSSSAQAQPIDPVDRAASIHAARQAFAERENAKARKYEMQERKAVERKEKRDEKKLRNRSTSIASSATTADTRMQEVRTVSYSQVKPASALPAMKKEEADVRRTPPKKQGLKSRYLRFLTWLKTRLLGFGRRR